MDWSGQTGLVEAHDLFPIINPPRSRSTIRNRVTDKDEPTICQQERVSGAVDTVAATHYFSVFVYPEQTHQDGIGQVDSLELPILQQEAMGPVRIDTIGIESDHLHIIIDSMRTSGHGSGAGHLE